MCEARHGFATSECQKNAEMCIKRILNVQNVHKTMALLNNEGTVVAVRFDASFVGSNKVNIFSCHTESSTVLGILF